MLRRVEVVVETLTPLHIGTGQKLTRDFDYVPLAGRTFRLNATKIAEDLYARDPKLLDMLRRTPPGQLLKPEDLHDGSPFVRYALPGEPTGSEFREQIKDASDRAYLPGSSLKGALRTVLAWHGWKELHLTLGEVATRESRPKFVARDAERRIFGKDPNHDFMRALRITDSAPLARTADGLQVDLVQVWTKRGEAAPISVEAVREGTRFPLEATIDETLFSDWSRRVPGFPLAHRDWLDRLLRLALDRATLRLKEERAIWTSWGNAPNPYDPLLSRLIALRQGEKDGGFPLQLGFGTGWGGTTIGTPLKEDPAWPDTFARLRIGKVPGKSGVNVRPEAFPTSRRMVVRQGGRHPLMPLGWVWVAWKEVG